VLPERQRAALVLCYYQDRSNIEAAEILGVSVDALESLLSRARRSLKTELAAERADLMSGIETG
jgi:RNA polymerase sigma-70 factor (ECF subfamily)